MRKDKIADGLLDLQAQHPDSRVTVDRRGHALIDPNQPPLPEVLEALAERGRHLNEGMGRSTLLGLELDADRLSA